MTTYLEIAVSASEAQREFLVAALMELGCEGFQETETELLSYANKARFPGESYQEFRAAVKSLLTTMSSNAEIRFREIADENWNAQWEKTIRPIEVGERFVIRPSWAAEPYPAGKIVIQIDPKMSFGTGYHETTRLMLRLLERHLRKQPVVLDVGTGTGVLAIAAVKLGARSATGIDNDPWSIDNARENVAANGVSGAVTIADQPLGAFSSRSVDVIAANLTLNTNLAMLPEFERILVPGGLVLLSGLLLTDEQEMSAGLRRHRFSQADRITEHEWVALAASNQG